MAAEDVFLHAEDLKRNENHSQKDEKRDGNNGANHQRRIGNGSEKIRSDSKMIQKRFEKGMSHGQWCDT